MPQEECASLHATFFRVSDSSQVPDDTWDLCDRDTQFGGLPLQDCDVTKGSIEATASKRRTIFRTDKKKSVIVNVSKSLSIAREGKKRQSPRWCSKPRHLHYKCNALPTELRGRQHTGKFCATQLNARRRPSNWAAPSLSSFFFNFFAPPRFFFDMTEPSASGFPVLADVLAALGAQASPGCTVTAPNSPALSAKRCAYLVRWIWATYDGDVFANGVTAPGYFARIAIPMHLRRVEEFTDSEHFDFALFLGLMRLVWSNACTFNDPSSPVHQVACRLAELWEARVVRAQRHPADDDPLRVGQVYLPLAFGLRQIDRFKPFVKPVDDRLYPTYPHHVLRATCFDAIVNGLENDAFVQRDDVVHECTRAAPAIRSSSLLGLNFLMPRSLASRRLCSGMRRGQRAGLQRYCAPLGRRRATPGRRRRRLARQIVGRHATAVSGSLAHAPAALSQHTDATQCRALGRLRFYARTDPPCPGLFRERRRHRRRPGHARFEGLYAARHVRARLLGPTQASPRRRRALRVKIRARRVVRCDADWRGAPRGRCWGCRLRRPRRTTHRPRLAP